MAIFTLFIFVLKHVKNKYNRIVRTDLSLHLSRFHHGGRGIGGGLDLSITLPGWKWIPLWPCSCYIMIVHIFCHFYVYRVVARGAWFSGLCSGREHWETSGEKVGQVQMMITCVWLQWLAGRDRLRDAGELHRLRERRRLVCVTAGWGKAGKLWIWKSCMFIELCRCGNLYFYVFL